MTRIRAAAVLAGLTLAGSLAACDAPDCARTRTAARDANALDLENVKRSSILGARLTIEGDRALPGRVVEFFVEDEHLGSDTTDAQGVARLDLKGRPVKLASLAGADSYTAAFGGDLTYCSSADEAAFGLVREPK